LTIQIIGLVELELHSYLANLVTYFILTPNKFIINLYCLK